LLSGYGGYAPGMELDAIAAVVIGGTLLTGGVWGTDQRHDRFHPAIQWNPEFVVDAHWRGGADTDLHRYSKHLLYEKEARLGAVFWASFRSIDRKASYFETFSFFGDVSWSCIDNVCLYRCRGAAIDRDCCRKYNS